MSKNIISNLMKQAQQMQERVKKLQEEAAGKTVEASSGGGMVTVVANGRQEVLSIKIDPSVVDPKDIEMLQDLVTAAVNEALRKSQDLMKEEMARLTAGMGLPRDCFRNCGFRNAECGVAEPQARCGQCPLTCVCGLTQKYGMRRSGQDSGGERARRSVPDACTCETSGQGRGTGC